MQLSQKFVHALKLSHQPAYKLAWQAGLHPNSLSKFVRGYLRPKKNDPRLLLIGQLLGLSASEVFEEAGHE